MQITRVAGESKQVHRIAVGVLFFLQGICFSSWASRIPDIQQKLGLSEAELGGVLFAIPIGLMISIPITGVLITKRGSRLIVIAALIMYSASLVSLGFVESTLQLVILLSIFGIAGNMSNISINTQAVGVEDLYKRSIMASFHGMWSMAGFVGAGIGLIMTGKSVPPLYHFLLIGLFIFSALMFTFPYTLTNDGNKKAGPAFVLPDRSLINLGIIAFCTMICEGAMFDWSGIYFKKVVRADEALIGMGYVAFMCTMATGRFIADSFTGKFGLKSTLQLSGLLTTVGLLISVIFPTFIPSIIGFFLVGFGVSSVVPLVYGAAGKSKKLSAGIAIAAVSTIGFSGFLIGPPLIGLVAGFFSLRISFLIIATMGLLTTLMASTLKKENP